LLNACAVSLIASAALGEAILFLAANTNLKLQGRRVALVRELSRVEVRRAFGLHEGCRVPARLLAGESLASLSELCHAAEYGTQAVMLRLRNAEPHNPHARVPAA